MSNTTQVSIAPPVLQDEPTAYLNTHDDRDAFSVVQLAPQMWVYIHEASHARAIAAAFTKAAQLLEDHAAAEGGEES